MSLAAVRRILLFLLLCATTPGLRAQTDTARGAHWYDTLTPTQPRLAEPTPSEITILRAASAVVIPVMFTVATATLVPPAIGVHFADGVATPMFFFGTGVGFGGDTALETFFPTVRVQVEGALPVASKREAELRLSAHRDLPVATLDRRGLYWFGFEGGAGIATTFGSVRPFAEGWLGAMTPMGIRYIGFYPMHHFGLRGRVGYDPATRRAWYEVGLGVTATFWF